MNIKEIRQKYPQYGDMSDGDLAQALHKRFYSDMPYEQFEKKVFDTKPIALGKEGLPAAIAETAKEFSTPSKFAIGAAGAVNSAAMRLKQMLGRDLTPADIQGLEEYKAIEQASGSAVAGNVGMQVLATLTPGAALYRGAATAAGKALPKGAQFLAPTAGAAVSGAALTAATTPTLEGETTVGNAGLGAAGSAAADTLTRGASRVVRPIVQSQAVQRLTKEGVVPTVGQAAGGFVNRVEQMLESVPLVGWMISGSRGRAVKEMNEAAIRKAIPAETPEVIKAGREGIERAGQIIDGAYDAAYGRITGRVSADEGFAKAMSSIPSREGVDLPPSLRERFDSLIKDRVTSRLESGADAEAIRKVHNSLGQLSRKYKSSGDPDQRALGQAFADAKSELRSLVSRQSSGEFKQALDALDGKYSALLSIEKASGYAGSKEGVFSAEALKRASKKSTSEMKDFSANASDVLGRTVPDSGTAGRMLLPLTGAALGGGNEFMGGPEWLTGVAAAPLLYSRLGSRYMQGGLPGQQVTAETIRELAPYLSMLGRASVLKEK